MSYKNAVRLSYQANGRLVLETPTGIPDWGQYLAALRQIPGRHWSPKRKVNTFPADAKRAVWRLLIRFFPGFSLEGPKGKFLIPAKVSPPIKVEVSSRPRMAPPGEEPKPAPKPVRPPYRGGWERKTPNPEELKAQAHEGLFNSTSMR